MRGILIEMFKRPSWDADQRKHSSGELLVRSQKYSPSFQAFKSINQKWNNMRDQQAERALNHLAPPHVQLILSIAHK